MPAPVELPADLLNRWPIASEPLLAGAPEALAALPINHHVAAAPVAGGAAAAGEAPVNFLEHRLGAYSKARNRPNEEGASGLSPCLHFGHISAHQVFVELMARERWTPEDLSARADGRRSGWWGLRASAGAFLDQLITWRERGLDFCFHRDDHDRYLAVPEWGQRSLRCRCWRRGWLPFGWV